METKIVIDREVKFYDNGTIEVSKTEGKKYTGGALKLASSFGYLLDWEVLALQVFARGLPENAIIVNIGSGAGTSGLAFAEARTDLIPTIYTVDIAEDGGALGGLLSERNAFSQYNTPLVNQIHGDSYDVGLSWDKGGIDLLFVDGNHSPEGIERDCKAWLPNVKEGGIVIFHDWNNYPWPGIKPCAELYMKDSVQLMVVDYLAVYRFHQNPEQVCTPETVATPVKRGRKPRASKTI